MSRKQLEKRLNTKKGQKHISETMREYLLSLDDSKIANLMLSFAYYYIIYRKLADDEIIAKIQHTLGIYNASCDKDYFLLQRLCNMQVYHEEDISCTDEILSEIAAMPYLMNDTLDDWGQKTLVQLHYSFILYDLPRDFLSHMIDYYLTFYHDGYGCDRLINCVRAPYAYERNDEPFEKKKSYAQFLTSKDSLFYQIIIHKHYVSGHFVDKYLESSQTKADIYDLFFTDGVFHEDIPSLDCDIYYDRIFEEFKEYNNEYIPAVPLKEMEPVVKKYGDLVLSKPCAKLQFIRKDGLCFGINTSVSLETKYYIGYGQDSRYCQSGPMQRLNIFCYQRRNFYSVSVSKYGSKGKAHPTSLKEIVIQAGYSPVIKDIWNRWFDIEAELFPFFKDVKKLFNLCVESGFSPIPMQLSEIEKYHNWNDYFCKKYVNSEALKVNYNKINPMVSYTAIKSLRKIKIEDIPLLANYIQCHPDDISFWQKEAKTSIEQLLYTYYCNRLHLLPSSGEGRDEANVTLLDYINMAFILKQPVTLRKKSMNKIKDLHDELVIKGYKKKTQKVSIPKKSKFRELRKILPGVEFEWITTRKRLIQETVLQHHCVWSYAPKITQDRCAIYSWVNPANGNRHTIEFVRDNQRDTYKVVQIQKAYDRGYDDEIIDRLKELKLVS
jgi:hypothetical protein